MRNRVSALVEHGYDCEILFYWNGPGRQWFDHLKVTIIHHTNGTGKSSERITDNMLQETAYKILTGTYDCIISFDHRIIKVLKELGYKGKIIYEHIYPQWFTNLDNISQYGADAIITPTEYHGKNVKQHLQKDIPIYTLPNCLGSEFDFKDDCEKHVIPLIQNLKTGKTMKKFSYRSRNLMTHKKYVAWIGRLVSRKNLKEFIAIACKVHKFHPDSAFLIVTTSTSETVYRKVKKYCRINRNLKVLSAFYSLVGVPLSEMPYVYSWIAKSGGCTVSTSKAESFGNVYMESMACRCPVVAPDISAEKEVIQDNITGLLYVPGNIGSAYQKIDALLTEQSLRTKLINNAFSYVYETHSKDKMIEKFNHILIKLNIL